MPQHRSKKQADKLPRRQAGAGGAPVQATADDGSHAWQRSQGGFSGKAKKEYLKWKRQQKGAAADVSAEEQQQDSAANGSSSNNTQLQAGITPAATGSIPSVPASTQQQHRQQQRARDSTADDPTQPLQYRPLVAVPAAPFDAAGPAAAAEAAAEPTQGTANSAATAAEASTPAAAAAAAEAAAAAGVVYMPRLDPAEVGFTPEGFALDMPTRPAWQGVVSSAEELHALEEQSFLQWQQALLHKAAAATMDAGGAAAADVSAAGAGAAAAAAAGGGNARAGGVGRLSFYEGRLEFWRQLWRTLEMSDLVLMIVDARNPLLHFSHALYRHITQHHGLPLVLLLNKCDLVPAAAAAAWKAWLQQQLPGVAVVPVSAAAGRAEAAARQVLEVVLQQRVERGGQQVLVQDFIGSNIDDLLAESLRRNLHAKRHLPQQQQHTDAEAQADMDSSIDTEDEAAGGAADSGDDAGSDADSDAGDWSMKPGRKAGSRKAGRKGGSTSRGKQQQQQQQQQARKPSNRAAAAGSAGRGSVKQASLAAASKADDAGSSDTSDAEINSESDEEPPAVHELLEGLTLERRLSSKTAGAPNAASCSGSRATSSAYVTTADAAAAVGGAGGASWQHDARPAVVGLLGEPNVGKSSTLNALLGTHRVAVSCHPGRTKHYQTHFMSSRLVLCDCPGIVFPRLDVSLPMQVLFGSYPIASCRQPYAVVRYLASASWPRLQQRLALSKPGEPQQQQQQQQQLEVAVHEDANASVSQAATNTTGSGSSSVIVQGSADGWSPWMLCEALAEKRHWVLPRSGRLDTYRAANWLLRAALGGQQGMGLAFLPPA
uniref:Guanine nucleotide-binding protein-like 1 n=1 Tax=Tetradesmus obliquus TaxID=3088 RepID=A0A383VR41_TETOB|eukprot:jgi/Sobl393_1/5155/SZX67988.1